MGMEINKNNIQHIELEILIEMDKVCRENGLTYSLAYGTVLGAARHKGFIPWDDDIDIMVDIDSYQYFCKAMQYKLPNKYFIYSYKTSPNYEYLFNRIGLRDVKHNQIHIDIFPMVGLPQSKYGRRIFSKVAYLTFRCYFVKMVDVRNNYKNEPAKRRISLLSKVVLFMFPQSLFIWIYEKLQKAFPISESEYLYNFCGLYKYKEIISKSYLSNLVYMDFEEQQFPVPENWHQYLVHMYGDYMTPKKSNYV